jgi:hypothetical protein
MHIDFDTADGPTCHTPGKKRAMKRPKWVIV